jgi:hypothetical protein
MVAIMAAISVLLLFQQALTPQYSLAIFCQLPKVLYSYHSIMLIVRPTCFTSFAREQTCYMHACCMHAGCPACLLADTTILTYHCYHISISFINLFVLIFANYTAFSWSSHLFSSTWSFLPAPLSHACLIVNIRRHQSTDSPLLPVLLVIQPVNLVNYISKHKQWHPCRSTVLTPPLFDNLPQLLPQTDQVASPHFHRPSSATLPVSQQNIFTQTVCLNRQKSCINSHKRSLRLHLFPLPLRKRDIIPALPCRTVIDPCQLDEEALRT